MILHSIVVENWRNFLGEHFVGPFEEGINILHAPNATGKSTLFEALQRALMDNHNTTGEDARKLRPWGRALSPGVRVEFTVGGKRYRVSKNFLDGPKSLLERHEDGQFKPLAEGPDADESTRKLFTEEGPRRGFSRPEHWGLRQILWAPQGRLEVGELSGHLLDDIRRTVAEQVVDDRVRAVESALQKKYEIFYTPTGRVKSASDLARLERDIKETYESLEEAKRELQEAEALSDQVEVLSEKSKILGEKVRRMKEEKIALDGRAAAYEKLKSKLNKHAADARAAEAEFRRQKGISDQIEEAESKREKLKQDLKELREALPEIEASRDEFALALEGTEAVLERAKAAVRQSEAGVAQARDAARAAALRERSGELAGKIGAIEGARKALLDLQAEKDAGRFPSLAGIRAIREAFSRLERAKIRLYASRVALEITPNDTFTGSVETEEGEEPLALEAGKAVRLEGAPEVRARIEGLGLIRAFSPLESALEAAEAVEAARGELKDLTEPFGVAEQSCLEELYEKGLSLDGRIEKERAGLNALLGGESEDTLSRRAEEIEGELQGIFEKYPAWKGAFPDPAELEASAAEQKRAADEEARRAEEDRNAAVKAHAEKDLRLKVAEEKLKGEQKGLESLEESLRKLRDDGLTEKERAEALAGSALAWDKAKVLAEEFAKQLAEYGADPAGELKKASEALERKATEFETTEKDHIRERARLETWSARGLYTTASDLEEKLSQLEDDRKREKLAADSTRLLRDVFAACRSEMAGTVNRAASARATEIFARIAGREGGRLLLAESMKPSGFVPGGIDGDVGIEPLSGGEKEQLHFAVRMALAECCSSEEERELLVLDDILMATDGIRFPRILEIIEEASECLQVLILTCQPERFASIEKANRIDLQDLTAGKG